jgi:RTX calcium-binding nonapeptide repeat (4 copies)
VRFIEQQPGVPTALAIDIDYVNPDDPSAKPPAVRNVVVQLAAGSRFDTSIPGNCPASDPQLIVQGAGACPTDSRVGGGFVRIDTGFPGQARYLDEDLTLLNHTNELIFLFTDRASGTRLTSRTAIQGGLGVSNAPPLPGTPPDGGALDVVHERLNAIPGYAGSRGHGYITTPDQCPGSRSWTNSVRFTYADGVSQTVETRSPCSPGGNDGVANQHQRCARLWRGTRMPNRHVGTAQGDRLIGLAGSDRLSGHGGADCIYGGRGDDRLQGGRGRDRLFGAAGHDYLRGGPGTDLLRGGAGADRIDALGGGRDTVRCGRGADRVEADPADRVSRSC